MPTPSTAQAIARVKNPCTAPSRTSPAARTRLESVSTPRPPRLSIARPTEGPSTADSSSAPEKRPNTAVRDRVRPCAVPRAATTTGRFIFDLRRRLYPATARRSRNHARGHPVFHDGDGFRFRRNRAFQQGAACEVLRKYPAGELVQAGGSSGLHQRRQDHAAGAAAAKIPPYVDREFTDAAVAGPIAVGKRSGKGDGSRLLGFGNAYKLPSSEPLGNLFGRPRLGLERRNTISDTFIVNCRNSPRIGHRGSPRLEIARVRHCA